MKLIYKGYRVLRDEGPNVFVNKSLRFVSQRIKWKIRRMRVRIYSIGSSRVCPICGFSARKFESAGTRSRKDALCQNCGAKERHRLLWICIINETELVDSDKMILYFAPTNIIVRKLRERGTKVITADLVMDEVDVHADITKLPFSDEVFDAVICSHVLEHIPDDKKAMTEMHRILVSGGDAMIMVPKSKTMSETYEDESITSPEVREEKFGTSKHVRLYGMDFSQRLSESGFDVSVETYAKELGDELTEKHGLRVDEQFLKREFEDIHHCRKITDD